MKKRTVTVALAALLFLAGHSLAMGASLGKAASSTPKRVSLEEAYKLYQVKCTTCHDRVADPDKPGKTRDEWHIVIKLMHDLGLDITEAEAETLVDYFFAIRKGMEKEAG